MNARVLVLFGLVAVTPAFGQWAVFDAVNFQQSITNYAAMVEQIARQGEQITNQVRQIQQMEERLKRMGNMADVKAIAGLPNLKLDLNLPTRIRVWAAQTADGRGVFGDTRGGVFAPIEQTFPDFDGGTISRASQPYAATQQITAKVDEFKEVQADVYTRRGQLKRAIAQTTDSLQAAETEAEEKKLEAVLNAQYNQLAALDSEVSLSAAEIQVRVAESTAMNNAKDEADNEARRKLVQQETQKFTAAFRPVYQSVLLNVNERPFRP